MTAMSTCWSKFRGPATYDGYFKLQDYLQELLGRSVDLVTERGLKPRARRHVEKDIVRVRDWLLYLDDVIECAEKIQRFLRTATLGTFSGDELLFDAVLYNLQVIGEAVKKLPAEARAMSPSVDWSDRRECATWSHITISRWIRKSFGRPPRSPAMRASLFEQGAESVPGKPQEFAAFIRAETVKWGGVIKAVGIKPE